MTVINIFYKAYGISWWETFLQIFYFRSMFTHDEFLSVRPGFWLFLTVSLKGTRQAEVRLLECNFLFIHIVKVTLLLSTQGIWGGKKTQDR